MARKNTLQAHLLTAQSLSADFNGPATIIQYLDNISYQINIVTSDSTGTFYIQGSNDYQVDGPTGTVINPGTWGDLVLNSGNPVAAAANDSALVNLNQVPFNALRVRYAHTVAGTGVMDLFIVAKQIGG